MSCFECGAAADHMHHVVPRCRGGTKTIPLCALCHGKVHDKDMTTSAMTKASLRARRSAGKCIGQVPLGYVLHNDGESLVPVAGEIAVVERIIAARFAGLSMRAIADQLTADKVPTKRGGPIWSHTTIQGILGSRSVLTTSKEATDGR